LPSSQKAATPARAERTLAVLIPLALRFGDAGSSLKSQLFAIWREKCSLVGRMQKTGIVQSFNVSPKGGLEGLLLEAEGEMIQINFRQEFAAEVMAAAAEGKEFQADVEAEEAHGDPSHPVFRLVSLGGQNGHFSGKVKHLNYALHGEVNGAILESGDFLHVKPHGAAALGLKPGMKVKGTGASKPMFDGHRVIEATEVNGIAMEKKPKPKKKAHR
jgi:hypothetical protein